MTKGQRVLFSTAALCAVMLFSSCASLRPSHRESEPLTLRHIRGGPETCLSDCAAMVLDYYGAEVLARVVTYDDGPVNVLGMDSLINALAEYQPDMELHSYVLKKDESFVLEQIQKRRPVILIVRGRGNVYHAVVAAGLSANGRAVYVHDPARRNGDWVRKSRLMSRWQQAGNVLLLIGISQSEKA